MDGGMNDAEELAQAWDEGCRAAEQYYKRTVVGMPGITPVPAPMNPYRRDK